MNTDAYGFLIYDHWVRLQRNGKRVSDFFKKNYYHRIAIYGMGRFGIQLCEELQGTDTEVVYAIDRRGDAVCFGDLDIISPDGVEEEKRPVDAIIVTPMPDFSVIEKRLSSVYKDVDIISIWDVVWCSKWL